MERGSVDAAELKRAGSRFWDALPCGPRQRDVTSRVAWYRRAEPGVFAVFDALPLDDVRFLDVGCGQGIFLREAAGRAAFAVGVDASGGSLSRARLNLAGVEARAVVVRADAERLPFSTGSFDVVTSLGVLHHTPDTGRSFRELVRVAAPGGRVLVMLYHRWSPKWATAQGVRALLRGLERTTGRRGVIEASLRRRYAAGRGESHGSAMLELVGVPVFKAFGAREARALADGLEDVRVWRSSIGLPRLLDFAPRVAGRLRPVLDRAERLFESRLGFYLYIVGRKPAASRNSSADRA